MNENTQHKVAVLAARSTIGQAVAARVKRSGGVVALLGRSLSGLDTATASFFAECEISNFDALESALIDAREALQGLTGIVNCAGSMILKPAHLTTRDEFDASIEANLSTAFSTVRAASRVFDSGGGSVVLVSSAAATLGMPNHELIAAAKAAIEGLVRSAAATYAPRSIRFNAVAPGLIATKLSSKLVTNKASLSISESLHPLGRIGNADEVASAICWLLDSEQSWVTGQIIGVDGGLSRVQPKPKLRSANP